MLCLPIKNCKFSKFCLHLNVPIYWSNVSHTNYILYQQTHIYCNGPISELSLNITVIAQTCMDTNKVIICHP